MPFDLSVDVHSVYIHWPFCPYRCKFCPFVAFASCQNFMERYHLALCKEIDVFSPSEKSYLSTVYVGGGTPSTYPCNLLLDMFDKLKDRFNFSEIKEVTMEVNPGTVQKKQLALWKDLGVNRLSVGVQSLDDNVLKNLNREQSSKDVYNLLETAPFYFSNISIDLIIGLPGVSSDEWMKMLHEVVSWPIKHISIYFLSVEEDTKLYFEIKSKKTKLPPEQGIIDLYEWSADFLADNGFDRYEISNFARDGFESQHNKAYWNRNPYKSFGVGACSFDGKSRFRNETCLVPYLEKVEQGQDVTIYQELLDQDQIETEKFMLSLRQKDGLDVEQILKNCKSDEKKKFYSCISDLEVQGLVLKNGKKIRLTSKGIPLENEVTLQLLRCKESCL